MLIPNIQVGLRLQGGAHGEENACGIAQSDDVFGLSGRFPVKTMTSVTTASQCSSTGQLDRRGLTVPRPPTWTAP